MDACRGRLKILLAEALSQPRLQAPADPCVTDDRRGGGGRHGPDSHITVETEAQSNNRRHSTGRYVPAKPWSTLQCRHPRIEKKVLGLLTDNFPYLSSEH